jgi:hypothetical protein
MSSITPTQTPLIVSARNRDYVLGKARRAPHRLRPALVLMVLAAFAAALVWFGLDALRFYNMELQGVETQAQVARRHQGTDGQGYYIDFRFAVEGDMQRVTREVDSEYYDRVVPGSVVSIIYLPYNPPAAQLAVTREIPAGSRTAAGIMGVIALMALSMYGFEDWLINRGHLIFGRVLETKPHGRDQVWIRYAYRSPVTLVEIEEQGSWPLGNDVPSTGDPLAILYVNRWLRRVL